MARKKAHHPPPTASPEARSRAAIAASPAALTPARRQPVILEEPAKPSARLAEVAGGTAAGCAAVCCCCPFVLVNLLVLTVVRLPAGLCQRALKARAKRRAVIQKRKAGLLGPSPSVSGEEEEGMGLHGAVVAVAVADEMWPAKPPSAEVTEMEKEMWAKFYSAGFWRSPSQREEEEEEEEER